MKHVIQKMHTTAEFLFHERHLFVKHKNRVSWVFFEQVQVPSRLTSRYRI